MARRCASDSEATRLPDVLIIRRCALFMNQILWIVSYLERLVDVCDRRTLRWSSSLGFRFELGESRGLVLDDDAERCDLCFWVACWAVCVEVESCGFVDDGLCFVNGFG
jgi:hypothetical protein